MKFSDGRRVFMQIGALSVFLVTSAVVLLYASGYAYRPKQNELVKVSVIDFPFSFSGADLLVDGKKIEGSFPHSIRVAPGVHDVEIKHEKFFPWKKSVTVNDENVSLFEELFFAPKVMSEDFLLWNVPSRRAQLLSVKPGLFLLFDKALLSVSVFDLNRSLLPGSRRMLRATVNLPFRVEEMLAYSDGKILFRKNGKVLWWTEETGGEQAEVKLSGYTRNFREDPSLQNGPLKELFPEPEDASSLVSLERNVGKSSQKLLIRSHQLLLQDNDGENRHVLFSGVSDFLESSEQNDVFAVFSRSQLKIFSPPLWNEVFAKGIFDGAK